MFSFFFGSSRNLPLTSSSSHEDWSAGTTLASSTWDVASLEDESFDKDADSKKRKQQKEELQQPQQQSSSSGRFPHSLRLDADRIAYSFCDLHSIPENQPRCHYEQVVKRSARRLRNRAMTSEQFHEILHKVMQEERLEREQQEQTMKQEEEEQGSKVDAKE